MRPPHEKRAFFTWIRRARGPAVTAKFAVLLFLIGAVTKAAAQAPQPAPAPPPCNSFPMQQNAHLSARQKFCYYAENKAFTGSAIFGAAFFSAVGPLWNKQVGGAPEFSGFGARFGTRYTQGLAKSTGAMIAGILNREDPRSRTPRSRRVTGFWRRTGSALLSTVWTSRDDGTKGIAFSHIAGAFASGFVALAWTPDPENNVGNAFKMSGTAFGGYIAASLFNEFGSDALGFLGRAFGGSAAKPAPPKANKP